MPSAGALPAPLITPLRDQFTASSNIDATTYIEISSETPKCKLYFTTDGSKPAPFQRKIGGREVTFKYFAPFTLKVGKRTIKAVAVSKDGLLESAVVSRTFNVRENETDTSSFFDTTTDTDTSTTFSWSKSRRKKSPAPKGLTNPREAWTGTVSYPYGTAPGSNDNTPPVGQVQIPDGPFNPINYSGNQINVWGAPPGGTWPNGMGFFGGGPSQPQYPVQYGFLTEHMIEGLQPKEKREPKEQPLTVADIRKLMLESKKDPSPAQPAIEYRPTYKDPPLNSVSAGNGMWSSQSWLHNDCAVLCPKGEPGDKGLVYWCDLPNRDPSLLGRLRRHNAIYYQK